VAKRLTKQQRLDAFLSQPDIWTRIAAMDDNQVLRLSTDACEIIPKEQMSRSIYCFDRYYSASDLEKLLAEKMEVKEDASSN
jgi:hypothetical protein